MELTLDNVNDLTTEQLSEIAWDMHKDVYGVRPRHMSTREELLSFISYELRPDIIEMRLAEWKDEAEYIAALEAKEHADAIARAELLASDDKYEPIDGRIGSIRIH